jgi:hypothetical protein
MTIRTRLTVLLGLALAAGCSRTPASSAAQAPVANGPRTVGPSGQNRSPSPVVAWLDCIECTPAQLQAVVALGDAAVPELTRTLATGPAQDRLDPQQKHIEASYATMKEYERQHADSRVPFTQQEYVQLYVRKYVLLNRMRSATALGAIGTTAAKTALTSALGQPDTPIELTREIERALKSSR